MGDNSGPTLFTLLPPRKPHWLSFAFSFGVQAGGLVLLAQAALIQPQKFVPKPLLYSAAALLTQTPPLQREAAPTQILPQLEMPRAVVRRTVPRPVFTPQDRSPEFVAHHSIPNAVTSVAPRMPQKLAIVQTGVFSTGSQALASLPKTTPKVQTGGFGDPNGIPANTNVKGRGPANIAQFGSFDLPRGPGHGNGSGGTRGARGTIASVGFGNGIAIGNADHSTPAPPRGAIQQSGFGDVRPATDDCPHSPTPSNPPVFTPVQILFKPVPLYTEEAREQHLEGEILLEVVFSAGGEARVVRVLHGLGHGLDEAAIRAAEQIRFRPATRNGQPIDFVASLRVRFQLAY